MKKVLKVIAWFLAALLALVVLLVGVLTVTEYRPADTETVIASHDTKATLKTGDPLTLITWNVGYGALGDNADFFMDGGKNVYSADKERVAENLAGMRDTLIRLNPDMVILQEVDINSTRSYGTDERTVLREVIPGGSEAFALNYKTIFVPYPIPPIGHVESGLFTLTRAEIREASRISLPCPFSWPVSTANLKRCLLVSRFPVEGSEGELVLINLHLEAFDSGEGKEAQTRMLQQILQTEFDKGNYVIAGGDFNQRCLDVDHSAYPVYEGKWQPGKFEAKDFGANYTVQMDSSVPTCRSLDQPLAGASLDSFQFYVIDGFVVSENVTVESLETLDEGFRYTDHNPVRLRFSLTAEQ